MTLINRNDCANQLKFLFEVNPVVAILGPRQCGKTTLAHLYAKTMSSEKKSILYLDLENPNDLTRLESPMLVLDETYDLIVIDEVQRRPALFPTLRVLVDKTQRKQKFLILGSASRDLLQQTSETLAGRISYMELTPFSYPEVDDMNTLWVRGGFPNSYLAKNIELSYEWRKSYVSTFLERDIPNLGIKIPAQALRRFWMMIAHYHGGIFNASEIGKSLGISHTTARHYLDILTGTFMLRELTPWFENINKRQIKSPKIYFRDSGIYHSLLDISHKAALMNHPKLGASWEGFALESIIRHYKVSSSEVYFWGVHNQGELDLLIFKNGKRYGFEFKYAEAPKITSSMNSAIDCLQLDNLTIIYPGHIKYILSEKIRVCGLSEYLSS
ncbi:MAG: ATP-binding protein [Gammaproteobacteria bacterium]|nr:ATP-binding protein [Gammaproteobacteria bacterium]